MFLSHVTRVRPVVRTELTIGRMRALLLASVLALGTVAAACGGASIESSPADDSAATAADLAASGDAAVAAEKPEPSSLRQLVATHTRFGQGGDDTELDITYVPPAFFALLGRDAPDGGDRLSGALFLVNESVHDDDELPLATSDVVMRLDDGTLLEPRSNEVLTDGYHHRSFRIVFDIDPETLPSLELVVRGRDGDLLAGGVFRWAQDGTEATAAAQAGATTGETP